MAIYSVYSALRTTFMLYDNELLGPRTGVQREFAWGGEAAGCNNFSHKTAGNSRAVDLSFHMLASYWRAGGLKRFFAVNVKEIEKRCDEVFKTLIEPVLEKEGTYLTFHGIENDNCAVISLDGDALTDEGMLRDRDMPDQILRVLQVKVPEVQRIRHKFIME